MAEDLSWPREVLKKAGIKKTCTELWRRKGGKADDILEYSLEWAFFTRCQWGQFDTALLELENAWNQNGPGAPLPVTLGDTTFSFEKKIRAATDVKAAVKHYCDCIQYDMVGNTAQHLSTDINYTDVSDDEMEAALVRRDQAGIEERDVYANYILDCLRDIGGTISFPPASER